jgi:hypothetical protein
MRKYSCCFIFSLIFSQITRAQDSLEYKPIKVDMGFGNTFQSNKFDGYLLYLEPSYTFAGKYKTGIRLEYAILNMNNIGSTALTFDYYYVRHSGLRLFAGGGFAHYNITSSGRCDPGPETEQTTSYTKSAGAMVRIGLEFNHLRFGMEYNMVPSTYMTVSGSGYQIGSTTIYKNSYFALKIGVSVGGGKKNQV